MAFTVREFRDLIRVLEEHPEWRDELRRQVLTDELLALPQLMRDLATQVRSLAEAQARTERQVEELASAQAQTEERMRSLEQVVERLAEAQTRAEERMTSLEQAVERLVEAQARTETRVTSLEQAVERLVEAQARTETRVASLEQAVEELVVAQRQTQQEVRALAEAMQTLTVDVGRLKDFGLEHQFERKAPAYLGRLLRGTQVVSKEALVRLLDVAVDEGRLSREERADLLLADLVVRGHPWEQPEREVHLVVEISWGIGPDNVERAVRRAEQLAHLMAPALPTVAGTWVTPDAKIMAQAMKVAQVTDGTVIVPEGWWPAS